ncbi:hypothetical protein SPAB_01550 [Salmonella enterica subsp. enterica serovar Paratyphi B str. SPB7]|uniref:Uncharacterized protein n=1 Tax=Salmonella paratyphi B (strain ATCC BAA-1250 / SPB7) TaxID=1016998 RepID=A0A6C6Z074_SALPB|nr:hypothetical protein SPAB_01550 [Salmonella enterica subsp. enterica serovar Paratyphi B str. SPB7]
MSEKVSIHDAEINLKREGKNRAMPVCTGCSPYYRRH